MKSEELVRDLVIDFLMYMIVYKFIRVTCIVILFQSIKFRFYLESVSSLHSENLMQTFPNAYFHKQEKRQHEAQFILY